MTATPFRTERLIAATLFACALLAAGCKSTTTESHPAAPAFTQIDPTTAATITGTIHFPQKPPPRIEIDMAQDPACSLSADPNFSEQYVVKDGKLQNVFVYIKDGLGNKLSAAPATPVTLDQKGCRYTPHVLGVMAGQPVEFTNSDPTMHNIHTTAENPANPAIDVSQPPKGGTTQKIFTKPELMVPVRCNNHPWMNAFINVAPNPFYAVSDPNGHFEIHGIPPGTYTLVADHEVLGQQTSQITVAARQTANADFTFGTSGAPAK